MNRKRKFEAAQKKFLHNLVENLNEILGKDIMTVFGVFVPSRLPKPDI